MIKKEKLRNLIKFFLKEILSVLKSKKINKKKWLKRQKSDELNFWNNPNKFESLDGFESFRDKYFFINKKMFNNLKLDFVGQTVADIGCGPECGFLPFILAKNKLGIDPLASEYQQNYLIENDVIMLNSPAECLPLLTESIDAIYCVNALDHMYKPYMALEEMYRVLKIGGYFALSVDLGGTPGHPIKILEKDINNFIDKHSFNIIEKHIGADRKSSWPDSMKIPLFVFQAIKR